MTIERVRRNNDPDRVVKVTHCRTVYVSDPLRELFDFWIGALYARAEGHLLSAEQMVAERMIGPIDIEQWPKRFWYKARGPEDRWGIFRWAYDIYSEEFDSDIDPWEPKFTRRTAYR